MSLRPWYRPLASALKPGDWWPGPWFKTLGLRFDVWPALAAAASAAGEALPRIGVDAYGSKCGGGDVNTACLSFFWRGCSAS